MLRSMASTKRGVCSPRKLLRTCWFEECFIFVICKQPINNNCFRFVTEMQACRRLAILSPLSRHVYHNKRTFATINPIKPEIYDVVCVGGGPAGLSLVNALRMSCTALETHYPNISFYQAPPSQRHTSRSPSSNRKN